MFDNLTGKMQEAFRKLRGQAIISEKNMAEAMNDIRNAMLDADVNQNIVEEFIETVKKDCLGESVIKSVTPGQQAIKIVYDRLVELMGESGVPLELKGFPSVIMMTGLHGSGKTTTSAKLAVELKKRNKRIMLVAGDIYRPAAIDQLEVLGKQIDVPVYTERNNPNVALIAKNAIEIAKRDGNDVVIIDTAGRLQIDAQMVQELIQIKQITAAAEIILVADAALGQEAVSVADSFHKALGLTGIILTKIDGDARGGAALSIRKVTNCPIKYVGVGEKIEDLEAFYPDRMASRILGMGDIVSLVEKAAEQIDREEAEKFQEKLKKKSFDFNDFLYHLKQMSKMGGVESILKMLPGGNQMASSAAFEPEKFKKMEAIICSMTKKERETPSLIDFARKKRIAKGSGTTLEDVSQLVKQFEMMNKVMKKTGIINRIMSGNLDLSGGMSSLPQKLARGSNRIPPKKKRKKRH